MRVEERENQTPFLGITHERADKEEGEREMEMRWLKLGL